MTSTMAKSGQLLTWATDVEYLEGVQENTWPNLDPLQNDFVKSCGDLSTAQSSNCILDQSSWGLLH